MSVRSLGLLCLLLFAVPGCATKTAQGPAGDAHVVIQNAAQLFESWNDHGPGNHTLSDVSAMRGEIDILKKALAATGDEHTGIALAFYTAQIEAALTANMKLSGTTIDRAMGEDALRNFDIVLAYKGDMSEWPINLIDAGYSAGSVSWSMDGTSDRTLRYWNNCAEQGHPGCINNVAFELTKRPAASDSDIRHALDLHATVVDTGNRARCAGQFSAVTMAQLIHFTGIERPGSDEIALLDNAQSLYQNLKSTTGAKDPCGGARIGLDEYMMRLDRGDRQESYLNSVLEQSSSPLWRRIAGYMQDRVSDAELTQTIAGADPQDACIYHFYAAWRATQRHQLRIAREHYNAMAGLDVQDCGPNTLMMQRYLKPVALR